MKWICKVDFRSSLILPLLLVLFFGAISHAQIPVKKSFNLVADTEGAWFLDGNLAFGVELNTASGVHKRTTGYLQGSMGWRNFDITCAQGVVKKGQILVDKEKVKSNDNTLTLIAKHKKDVSMVDTLHIPMPKPVALKLILDDANQVIPGAVIIPTVQVRYDNRIVYTCQPWSEKSMLSPDLLSLYYGKEVVSNGRIIIGRDVKETMINPIVSIICNENQDVYDTRELTLTFIDAESAYYSEPPALDGMHGKDGVSGQNGQDGQYGQAGADARLLKVYMWLDQDSALLRVKTDYEHIINEYTLIPATTRLNIIIKGADGGTGGNGGAGGKAIKGAAQNGGLGGNGGNGGKGGRGGIIEIYVAPDAEKYLAQLNINNSGGAGGKAGKAGRGGKRMANESGSLFEAIFPGRNDDGVDGVEGMYGENGPPAIILPWSPEID